MTKERIQKITKSAGQRVDKFLNRWISRKLMAFGVGSVGLFTGNLDSGDWVIVATAYVTIQGFTDIVERIYKAKSN